MKDGIHGLKVCWVLSDVLSSPKSYAELKDCVTRDMADMEAMTGITRGNCNHVKLERKLNRQVILGIQCIEDVK